ncbi:MAG: hypothetical protein ACOCW7_03420 [Bacteroidota bacterium]
MFKSKNAYSFYLQITVLLVFTGILPHGLYAQSCCSGGVPMAGNVGGISNVERGNLSLSLKMDANILQTLKNGTQILDDQSRRRTTYSALLKGMYSISDYLAVEGMLSYVRQERTIRQDISEDFAFLQGFGDALLMIHFKYLEMDNIQLFLGAGPRIPLGASDLKNSRGITMNADMQPGSGAWDAFLHHRISWFLPFLPSSSAHFMITYRLTGENDQYLGSQVYEIGNELQLLLGYSGQIFASDQLFDYGLNVRYRNAGKDTNNGQTIPETGGDWFFLMPSITWYLNNQISIRLNAEIPLHSRTIGTQISPTYRINTGIFWNIPLIRKTVQLPAENDGLIRVL